MRFPRSQTACGAGLHDRLQRLDSERLSWRMATGAHTGEAERSGEGADGLLLFASQSDSSR